MTGNYWPRVIAITTARSAVEMYRVYSPLAHLREQGFQVAWVPAKKLHLVPIDDWDVVVLDRSGLHTKEEADGFFDACHQLGKTVVYELDDDLFNMPVHNPSRMPESDLEQFADMIRRSDAVTVSTHHLAKQIKQYNPEVYVLENCIDPDLWHFPDGKKAVRTIEGVTVGLQGGHSHYHDWALLQGVIPRLLRDRPQVKFVVAGYHPDYFDEMDLGDRYIKIGWMPIEYYPAVVAQFDINLCPLESNLFNLSKSPIKFMESAALGIPSVCSPIVYGNWVTHQRTGFLAQGEDEWLRYIERLVDKPQLRREIGRAARGYVERHLNIHHEALRWMEAYRRAWRRVATRRQRD